MESEVRSSVNLFGVKAVFSHISGRSFLSRARALGMAECRVFVKNLHFAVTQKAIADVLSHAGFLVSRIQIQRSGLRFQQSRYCYAFLTVPNEEVQAALVSHLDKKIHPALSDKALFAEPAVPRMRNWPQEDSVKAEVIQAPPGPEEAQPQPEAARAAEPSLVEPPPLDPEKAESVLQGQAQGSSAAATVACEKGGPESCPAGSKKEDPAKEEVPEPAKDNVLENEDKSDTSPASRGCVAATGSDTEKSSGSGKAAGSQAAGSKVESASQTRKTPSPPSRPSRPRSKRKKDKARRTRPSRPRRKRRKKPAASCTARSRSS